jgi:hypothetical protein
MAAGLDLRALSLVAQVQIVLALLFDTNIIEGQKVLLMLMLRLVPTLAHIFMPTQVGGDTRLAGIMLSTPTTSRSLINLTTWAAWPTLCRSPKQPRP